MNAITTTHDARPSTGLVPHNIDEALRLAEFMSRARTVPKHLQDSPGDCLMVVEQAMRWGMSPFAVAQATSVISGKLMYEGKLVAAAVENSGAIVGQFDYQFSGEGDAHAITVSATRRGETNPRTVTVALKDARTSNEMWKRQPDQQLVYHGSRVWARRWAPAVILGVYSREEMGPIIDGQVVSDETPPEPDARDALNAEVPLKAAASDMKRPPRVTETDEDERLRNREIWLQNVETKFAAARSRAEVMLVAELKSVKAAREGGAPEVQERLVELMANAYERFPTDKTTWTPDLSEELPEVEIAGEEKVAAG